MEYILRLDDTLPTASAAHQSPATIEKVSPEFLIQHYAHFSPSANILSSLHRKIMLLGIFSLGILVVSSPSLPQNYP